MRIFIAAILSIAMSLSNVILAVADEFQRPIPQAQSATAEIWFGLASFMLLVALVVVHLVIKRR